MKESQTTACINCEHCHRPHPLCNFECLASPRIWVVDEFTGKPWIIYYQISDINDGHCWKYWSNTVPVKFGLLKTLWRYLFLGRLRRGVKERGLRFTYNHVVPSRLDVSNPPKGGSGVSR